MKCQYCKSKDLDEWGIIRNGDTRKEEITFMCNKCKKTTTGEEHNY